MTGRAMAVLFIGLDGFRVVNDLFGHGVGDDVLREMADRLTRICPDSDCVARVGGDTFVVVCPHVIEVADVEVVADHLLEAMAQVVSLNGVEHRITASIGLVITQPAPSPLAMDNLLRNAEIAMFKAKDAGRGCRVAFDSSMRARAMERFEVDRGLRSALERGNFSLLYQPIVDARSSLVAGAEALIRWDRPEMGTMLPGSFLDVAEDSGLVVPMGTWAMDRALSDLSKHTAQHRFPEQFRIWVNVSPQQLIVPGFAEVVYDRLEFYGVAPDLLGLEILEQALLDVNETERVLTALRAMGVALHLDDFGAGHSNLWWLQELPITGIKIDRRFVSSLDDTGNDASIAGGLVQLGHSLGLTVVAEGVETGAQATSVGALGCDLAQGFFYGFPGSSEQLWQLIAFESEVHGRPEEAIAETVEPA